LALQSHLPKIAMPKQNTSQNSKLTHLLLCGESILFHYHLQQLRKSTDAPCRIPWGSGANQGWLDTEQEPLKENHSAILLGRWEMKIHHSCKA